MTPAEQLALNFDAIDRALQIAVSTSIDSLEYALAPARARRTDPATAHASAAALTPHLPALEALLLEALRTAGEQGMTSRELAEATGVEHITVSPRLRPLERKGFAIETDETRIGPTGRRSIVWKAKQ